MSWESIRFASFTRTDSIDWLMRWGCFQWIQDGNSNAKFYPSQSYRQSIRFVDFALQHYSFRNGFHGFVYYIAGDYLCKWYCKVGGKFITNCRRPAQISSFKSLRPNFFKWCFQDKPYFENLFAGSWLCTCTPYNHCTINPMALSKIHGRFSFRLSRIECSRIAQTTILLNWHARWRPTCRKQATIIILRNWYWTLRWYWPTTRDMSQHCSPPPGPSFVIRFYKNHLSNRAWNLARFLSFLYEFWMFICIFYCNLPDSISRFS